MAKEQEVDHRILLLEQVMLEILRKTNIFTRKRIMRTLHERFSYSKPLLEIVRYTELELEALDRDDFTKYSDFMTHRSNLERAYEDEKKETKGPAPLFDRAQREKKS